MQNWILKMGKVNVALVVAAFLALQIVSSQGQLLVHFYDASCPRAESIVTEAVTAAFQKDKVSAARLLRLFFHDCFVGGCDGSILIDPRPGNASEKSASPNLTVAGYEIIDAAKTTLEAVCAQTVSCADIVALAARDAVALSGGPVFEMPTGRRDRMAPFPASVVNSNIPDPSLQLDQILSLFNSKGLSESDLVVLSGSHTIGVAHCGAFANRLPSTNNGTAATDPTLDPGFAQSLQMSCASSANPSATVPLDTLTGTQFDNAYYMNLQQGKGLLSSDEVLFSDTRTKSLVGTFATDQIVFFANFPLAMLKLGEIGVITGTEGQIRTNCRVV